MNLKRVKVYTIQGTDIYFDTDVERFFIGEEEYRTLFEAREKVGRTLKEKFEGEFLIIGYEGIKEFKAERKFYSNYSNCWQIGGISTDKYGRKQPERYEQEILFPRSKENLAILEKARKMDRDGWSLIHQAENLKLVK